MNTIQINVSDYYGKPQYYPIMPPPIFDALEAATLNGEDFAQVDKGQFDKMVGEYIFKCKQP